MFRMSCHVLFTRETTAVVIASVGDTMHYYALHGVVVLHNHPLVTFFHLIPSTRSWLWDYRCAIDAAFGSTEASATEWRIAEVGNATKNHSSARLGQSFLAALCEC